MNATLFLQAVAKAIEETARHGVADEHFEQVPAQVAVNLYNQALGLVVEQDAHALIVRSPCGRFELFLDCQHAPDAKPPAKASTPLPPVRWPLHH